MFCLVPSLYDYVHGVVRLSGTPMSTQLVKRHAA